MRPRQATLGGLGKDTRGAALIEFLIALLPLMIAFSSFVQLAQIAAARLVVKHAAVVGARGAAVISNAHNNTPDQRPGANVDVVKRGVLAAMGPWKGTMQEVSVTVEDHSSCGDNVFEPVIVTVEVEYRCAVPFGGMIVCGPRGGTHHIKQTFAFPHQGASYKEGGGGGCGGSGGGGPWTGGGGASGGAGASGRW